MTECSCLTTKYYFSFYKRRKKPRFWQCDTIGFSVYNKTFTVHGSTIGELELSLESIKTELLKRYPDTEYKMYVGGAS